MSTATNTSIALSVPRRFYLLTKPGIIYGNLLSVVGGYLLGSQGVVNYTSLIGVIVGTALIIGSGCVINNYTDRNIDAKMSRTKNRSLVTGDIDTQTALLFGVILGLLGFLSLSMLTNIMTVVIGAVGLFSYVVMYAIAKRNSVHGTLVGSISGATPPIAGYTAATGQFDLAAVLLFLALVFWQMPHFYAIAMYRRKDYAAAHLPVLPVAKGDAVTKRQIILYMIGFCLVLLGFVLTSTTGITFAVVMAFVVAWWLKIAIAGFSAPDNAAWARKVFGHSLVVLLVFSALLSAEWFLP